MDFTENELHVLKALLTSEKAKVLEHTSRVDILEKIIDEMENGSDSLLICRVFEIMRDSDRKTLNSIAKQIREEKLVKGCKTHVYERIQRVFQFPISKDGETLHIETFPDATGCLIRYLSRVLL